MNAVLELTGVHTHIGAYHILHGVDLAVPEGQVTSSPARAPGTTRVAASLKSRPNSAKSAVATMNSPAPPAASKG